MKLLNKLKKRLCKHDFKRDYSFSVYPCTLPESLRIHGEGKRARKIMYRCSKCGEVYYEYEIVK